MHHWQAELAAAARRPEADCVRELLPQARLAPAAQQAARALAADLIVALRAQRRRASGVDALMREFSLATQEGVALMCLAEALLRIPDTATRDALIRDKLSRGDWRAHVGHSTSLFVNAAAWGLMIGGQLLATHSEGTLAAALTRLLMRGGEPLLRAAVDLAMRLLGQQFVLGQSIKEALARAQAGEARGYRYSFDMLGEAALTAADAQRYFDAYAQAIEAVGAAARGRGVFDGPGVSVKLSALHPRYGRAQRERVLAELLPRLAHLARRAAAHDIGLTIDAEESERLALSLEIFAALAADAALAGWEGLGLAVQTYGKRAALVIDFAAELARAQRRRFAVRLVKGAYWDSEIKRAQVEGQTDYPVFTRKVHTDVSYLACARRLLAAAHRLYPQFATHNAATVAALLQMVREAGAARWEFQCLHGMGEPLYDLLRARGGAQPFVCRIYAPVGTHETLLPYLVRRLLENGANASFVHRVVDEAVSVEELLADPCELAQATGGAPHPQVPRPADLYLPLRRNSQGLDLNDEPTLAQLQRAFAQAAAQRWHAAPLLAQPVADGPPRPVHNPARCEQVVGMVHEATEAQIEAALAAADASAAAWAALPADARAQRLDRAADLLEENRERLMWLAIAEAGKTIGNALAEVREAADFLRYYAAQARRLGEAGSPLGVVAAISPWNFPLAIFVGQVAAALAAGNAVLAKPAEQTPLVAAAATHLLHAAGIPRGVLQLLPGNGSVGARLVADTRVRGVLFTGSTEVATQIDRTLAARAGEEEIPLVAETGGINAMIVDSSALPEQVVTDALQSAFDSAGQRCSALRVLCLQEEIAERVLPMLYGAAAELRLGDPAELATDLGPVIDEPARRALESYIARMATAYPVRRFGTTPANGTFVAPAIIEIPSLAVLSREVFGPVLHVLRYRREQLQALVQQINALGYGLTLGIHSRIQETIDAIVAGARVGNIYVNRNMIGAMVGVQPFGGEGLSGTGPKAGGPLLLPRLRRMPAIDLLALGATPVTPPPLPALAALRDWARAQGWNALAATCEAYGANTPLGFRFDLPGPTGESNRLTLHARGVALCCARSAPALLEQMAAALATGNRVALAAAQRELLPAQLPAAVRAAIVDDDVAPDVALAEDAAHAAALRRALAQREGRRVRVVARGADGYALIGLTVERTVSVNTAAAGGNAALMTLSPA